MNYTHNQFKILSLYFTVVIEESCIENNVDLDPNVPRLF